MSNTNDTPGQQDVISSLKSRIAELEQNQISDEDRIKLAILERAPFTMWACDRNFKIVLWNKVCEQLYGVTANEALGADYIQLFVDPVEQEQSRIDCLRTIDKDVTFKNFLAYDHAQDGSRRTVLTNVFRVWDSKRNDYLQAEVALEISDLELRKDEHRTLREVGIARLEQQKKLIDLQKSELLSRLAGFYSAQLRSVEREQDRLDEFIEKLLAQNVKREEVDAMTRNGREKAETDRKRIQSTYLEITSQIINASKLEELDTVEVEMKKFATAINIKS